MLRTARQSQHSKRALFLHGQAVNLGVVEHALGSTGWTAMLHSLGYEVVIPQGPFQCAMYTNQDQLRLLDLAALQQRGLYATGERVFEWAADFDAFARIQANPNSESLTPGEREAQAARYSEAFEAVEELARTHGPFDLVVGFCQGATMAAALLHEQRLRPTADFGLANCTKFVSIAGWLCPYKTATNSGEAEQMDAAVKALVMCGDQDMQLFIDAQAPLARRFSDAQLVEFPGRHVHPNLAANPTLRDHVVRFLAM